MTLPPSISGAPVTSVTVLTSMDEKDMIDAGYEYDPHTLVLRRAEQALSTGMGGIVCSASEAAAVRRIVGPDLAVVTPGIRPAGTPAHDQARAATPQEAFDAGADLLVIGRAVTEAPDPVVAASELVESITL